MKKIYYKSFLLYVQILLGGTFLFFTFMGLVDYKEHILTGYSLSILIIVLYAFLLYTSFQYWQKERVGLAYFITIVSFLILSFLQINTCIYSAQPYF